MYLSQKQMEKKLSLEAKELWRIIKGVVKSGNCLIDDGDEIKSIKRVVLAADSKELVKGFVFKTY